MNEQIRSLMSNVNTSIIQIRGAYAAWAKEHGLNYHETLIFYAMRDNEECTQKQIADSYRLPKQTVNNIITTLKKRGYIELVYGENNRKEKILKLTETGQAYYNRIMESIMKFEQMASERMGEERIRQMTDIAMEFGKILEDTIQIQRGQQTGEQRENGTEDTDRAE